MHDTIARPAHFDRFFILRTRPRANPQASARRLRISKESQHFYTHGNGFATAYAKRRHATLATRLAQGAH